MKEILNDEKVLMTTPTPEQLSRALSFAEQAQENHGHKGAAIWAMEAALAAIIATEARVTERAANFADSEGIRVRDEPTDDWSDEDIKWRAVEVLTLFGFGSRLRANEHMKGDD